jgi:hypothetical protein
MAESDFSSSLELRDIELPEKEKERENLLEDALLDLILRCFHASLLRKDKRKFPA